MTVSSMARWMCWGNNCVHGIQLAGGGRVVLPAFMFVSLRTRARLVALLMPRTVVNFSFKMAGGLRLGQWDYRV